MALHTIQTTIASDGAVEAGCACHGWHGGTFTCLPVAERAHEAHTALCTPIARPRVPVRHLAPAEVVDGRTVIAECRHCSWTHHGHMKAEIELEVAAHRNEHRLGAIEVTP